MTSLALVTGGTGWLGGRLLKALVHGLPDVPELASPDPSLSIRCLVPPGEDAAALASISGRISGVAGDVRDAAAVERFCADAKGATLFHCAGIIHPARRTREFFEVNSEGSRRVLEAAERAGVSRAVVLSSNSPFGGNPDRDHRFDERSPYAPYMGYGRSKMEMEQCVAEVERRGQLQTVVVRAPWFYGPDQPERQTTFFSMVRRGVVPIVGGGENLRSMAYLDNLCQGLLLCARRPEAAGRTYWIADRRPYSMNEIVGTIARLLETEFGLTVTRPRLRLPAVVGHAARLADAAIQACGFYHQKVHVLSEMGQTIACSVAEAEASLGYDPRIELEEGMRRSLQWCVDRGIEI